ncbi:unnamed protein product [Orchesella dallaii]|uniref:F-box domain-containing protein n=1 Tax=Orchesella dallaii TaxID=48710 RepID=A0ABP1RDH1_9HEXA
MNSIETLPNEILCKILGFLSTHEKFRAREVCQKWKGQVDENVPFFDVILSNSSDPAVLARFQTRRVASIILPGPSYLCSNIPIQNLSHLCRLKLVGNVVGPAVTDLATRAVNLTELEIWMNLDSDWPERKKTCELLPALRKIKNLYLRNSFGGIAWFTFECWKPILRDEMPKLKRLEIDVSRWRATDRDTNLFGVVTFKPSANLCEFSLYNSSETQPEGLNSYVRVAAGWEERSEGASASKGLRKLNLIGVTRRVVTDYKQWGILLSDQGNLEELQLYDSYSHFPGCGYDMSIIQQALRNNVDSLHTIRLDIEADRGSNEFDMGIFAPLATLRHLHLIRPGGILRDSGRIVRDLCRIQNCSTVIKGTLRSLLLYGFKFQKQEIDDVIKEMVKLNLERVEFARSAVFEIGVGWNYFQRLALQMNMKPEVKVIMTFLPSGSYGVEFRFIPNANSS